MAGSYSETYYFALMSAEKHTFPPYVNSKKKQKSALQTDSPFLLMTLCVSHFLGSSK